MHVVFLEGCHGIGKSSIATALRNMGYTVMPEVLPTPHVDYPSSSLVYQCRYVTLRLHLILEYCRSVAAQHRSKHVVFADRGFLSSLAYASPVHLPHITALVLDAQAALLNAGISFCCVTVDLPKTVVWSRVQQRLLDHPERAAFNEGSYLHFERVYDYYVNCPGFCFRIPTVSAPADFLAEQFTSCVQRHGSILDSSLLFLGSPSPSLPPTFHDEPVSSYRILADSTCCSDPARSQGSCPD